MYYTIYDCVIVFKYSSNHCKDCLLVVTKDRRVLKNPFQNVFNQQYNDQSWETENGEITSFHYTKNNDYTALRLTASGVHRIRYATGYAECSRW